MPNFITLIDEGGLTHYIDIESILVISEDSPIQTRVYYARDEAVSGNFTNDSKSLAQFLLDNEAAFNAAGSPLIPIISGIPSSTLKYVSGAGVQRMSLSLDGLSMTISVKQDFIHLGSQTDTVSYSPVSGTVSANLPALLASFTGSAGGTGITINNSGDGTIDVEANGVDAVVTIDNTGTGDVTINSTDVSELNNQGDGTVTVMNGDNAVVNNTADGAITVDNGDDATVNNSGTGAVTVNNA